MARLTLLILLPFSLLFADWNKTHYSLTNEPIDVVIPCAPKDRETLLLCIEAIRQYGENIRRIIVVSKERLTEKAEWFAESSYPFTKEDLSKAIHHGDEKKSSKFIHKKHSRIGWIYQQFLKLYAPLVIPDISSNVLILDADVVFIAPVSFMDREGNPFFNVATEYHLPYFDHMKRLFPELIRVHAEHSGVTHHMLFQKPILQDFFAHLTEKFKCEPWRAICSEINPKELSSLSEYEMYFNFALLRTDQAKIRPLTFADVHPIQKIEKYQQKGYAYLTSHERP